MDKPIRTSVSLYEAQHDHYLPATIRLPDAPNMKIYCLYGHGKDTEVMSVLRIDVTLLTFES